MTNPSFWQKLCEKSVDIAAHTTEHVLSAILIGLVALLTWKGKTWLDARKEAKIYRERLKIDDELAKDRASHGRQQQADRLRAELDTLVQEASEAHDEGPGTDVMISYTKWLDDTHLRMWRRNLRLFNRWKDAPWEAEDGLRKFEADVRSTEIPTADDADFPWT